MARIGETLVRHRRAVAAALVAAAVAAGALIGWRTTAGFEGRYTMPAAGAVSPTAAAGPFPPPVGPAAPVRTVPVATAPSPAIAEDDGEGVAVDEDADRIGRAIARATRKALRRGEPVRWHKAGEEGYVTVSDARDDGERLCRNVVATIAGADGQTRSSSHRWCSEDGDEWEPAR